MVEGGQEILVILGEETDSEVKLAEVGKAGGLSCGCPDAAGQGNEYGGEYADDRDDGEEFDEGKSVADRVTRHVVVGLSAVCARRVET